MATRRNFIHSEISSTVAGVAGNALTAQLANCWFPESNNKVNSLGFATTNKVATAGATPAELFIDGIQNYRLSFPDRSTAVFRLMGVYNSSVAANNTSFDIVVTAQNVGGTVTILGTTVNTKNPAASTAAINISVDAANQALTFVAVGVAGDTNGQWDLELYNATVVTDLG